MSGLDIESLLEPVSDAAPSGDDLEYDPAFEEMRQAAAGEPERRMGDSVVPAVEPDWKQATAIGAELLSRTKDLRISVLLAQCLLHTDGFPGLARGLGLTLGLLERFWDSVHPQLDPEDNNDPTARVNALVDLCDLDGFLNPLRLTPLAFSRVLGQVSLRDVEIAEGRVQAPAGSEPTPDQATIDATFRDCEIDALGETASAVSGALGTTRKIETLMTDRVGAGDSPDLSALSDLLAEAEALLKKHVAERAAETAPGSPGGADASAPAEGTEPPGQGVSPSAPVGGEIRGREDVVRTLDRICEYYARNEPSSPIPLLLKRARRLVTMDFVDIVRDLAPDALAQVEALRGTEPDT